MKSGRRNMLVSVGLAVAALFVFGLAGCGESEEGALPTQSDVEKLKEEAKEEAEEAVEEAAEEAAEALEETTVPTKPKDHPAH
jgi:hypothetical protein